MEEKRERVSATRVIMAGEKLNGLAVGDDSWRAS